MSKKPEQVGKGARVIKMKPSGWRNIKKGTRRAMRREGKRDPEDAPKKTPYGGTVA